MSLGSDGLDVIQTWLFLYAAGIQKNCVVRVIMPIRIGRTTDILFLFKQLH